ncbi:Hypothetical protein NTJ_10426 [Nesidiocoris tenuis]|uniref:Uncharacterized protein n=1 Tax=Nesidiocoris tenuis TaxID=355587 RepID=A0ABN7B4D1_9HEMI|nr:Hypothetical protein NTJ_10426 [Nesidiocoris tenuis]
MRRRTAQESRQCGDQGQRWRALVLSRCQVGWFSEASNGTGWHGRGVTSPVRWVGSSCRSTQLPSFQNDRGRSSLGKESLRNVANMEHALHPFTVGFDCDLLLLEGTSFDPTESPYTFLRRTIPPLPAGNIKTLEFERNNCLGMESVSSGKAYLPMHF